MKIRSLTLIVLIVLLPTGLLTWFAVRMAQDDAAMTEQRFRSLMEQRLQDVNRLISRQFSDTERQLRQITTVDDFSLEILRERVRLAPQVTQLFVLTPNGELLYPNLTRSLNGTEQSFLNQTGRMFAERDIQNAVAQAEAAAGRGDFAPSLEFAESAAESGAVPQISRSAADAADVSGQAAKVRGGVGTTPMPQLPVAKSSSIPASGGGFVWYWDRGLNLVYWQRRPSGHVVGAALERSRWIADIISVLPETVDSSTAADQLNLSCRVVNSASETVYDWGPEIVGDSTPFCEVPVAAPLASWRLQCFVPKSQMLDGTGRSAIVSLATGLSAFTLTLVVLAWLLYRDYSRDIREATQQVSFVNQVSHELKTPLTNIRMYAELLERDLEDVDEERAARPRERLSVITSEAQRLSRLIGNVLTFARQKRKTLEPRPRDTNISDLVHQIVERFAPSLSEHGIVATVEGSTERILCVDPDFVEQIIGNLINNVEKYAASGNQLIVRCGVTETRATIDVIDAGPGISVEHRASVFRPFARLNNDLLASAGTGIGLSIARDLARLHQGDVSLMDSSHGCWFRVELGSIKSQTAIG